ncbi:MAG: thiol-disulfide oxidoreductase DCC family protein [Planctomycetes bacterium]|nr:thiol-disulfide oxidoreductase DCC family protein [Planctomycetota bacterium]
MSDPEKPILFFDGVCGLCNRFVDFSLDHDPHGSVLFAPLQGTTAAGLLPQEDVENIDTVVFHENGRLHRRSSAIVKLLAGIGGGWKVLSWLLWLVPKPLRDLGYRLVARYRYRIFGQKETCRFPTPEERERFLD